MEEFLGIPNANPISPDNVFAPFSNPPSGIYLAWNYLDSNIKSGVKADHFAKLQQDLCYKTEEPKTFSFACETKWLDDILDSKGNSFCSDYGLHQSSVKIKLPYDTLPPTGSEVPQMTIDGVWHQDIYCGYHH